MGIDLRNISNLEKSVWIRLSHTHFTCVFQGGAVYQWERGTGAVRGPEGRRPGSASSLPALGAHRWFALAVLPRLGSETGFQSSVLQPFDAFPSERWSAVLCVSQLSYLPGLLGQPCWGIASLLFRGEVISSQCPSSSVHNLSQEDTFLNGLPSPQ